jgi:hypothetical protein
MRKIVITNPMGLSEEQKSRLKKLGKVNFYESYPSSPGDWLKRCQGYEA